MTETVICVANSRSRLIWSRVRVIIVFICVDVQENYSNDVTSRQLLLPASR